MKLKKRNPRLVKLGLFTGTVAGLLSSSFVLTPLSYAVGANPQQTEINVTLEPNISISLDSDAISLELDPTANGGFGSASTGVLVSTNDVNGYTVYIAAETDQTELKHNVSSITTQIPTLTTATDEANFPTNHWGYYNLIDGEYDGIPEHSSTGSGAIVYSTNSGGTWLDPDDDSQADAIAAAKFNLTIGAKADSNLVSGNYSNTVVLTAVTNS